MDPSSAPELMAKFEKLIRENRDKMVAVGETGLDYFHVTRGKEQFQKERQRVFFEAQAELALRLDLPLVIHTRDAAEHERPPVPRDPLDVHE